MASKFSRTEDITERARDRYMSARGYHVLRFSVEDMDRGFKDVVETIYARVQLGLQERDSRSKPTSP